MRENRTSARGIEQLGLFDGWPSPAGAVYGVDDTDSRLRGGGSAGGPGGSGGGGGYLKICGAENVGFAVPGRDPRLAELEKVGLPRLWLAVAERVGFDAWLDLWRMLSSDRARDREEGGLRMPKLRDFDAYLRFQRNRYIEALARQDVEPAEIRKLVEKNLGERLDESHVERLVRSAVGFRYVRDAAGRRVRLEKRERPKDGTEKEQGGDLRPGVVGAAGGGRPAGAEPA